MGKISDTLTNTANFLVSSFTQPDLSLADRSMTAAYSGKLTKDAETSDQTRQNCIGCRIVSTLSLSIGSLFILHNTLTYSNGLKGLKRNMLVAGGTLISAGLLSLAVVQALDLKEFPLDYKKYISDDQASK